MEAAMDATTIIGLEISVINDWDRTHAVETDMWNQTASARTLACF
jgi:hypothetical protein